MKIKNIDYWSEDYYPSKEKIKRKKPRKKDLDYTDKVLTVKKNKK